ncbi:MAG: hypothetical protein DMF05_11565 [Verrucomicrobia bacterium]|nr:MAG: hypothetical protein DMF05_11565 [Verrucomicrobiota bacterium]
MKTLALELSTSRGSLAWLDGEIEFTREWPNDRKNSAAFLVLRKRSLSVLALARMLGRASRYRPRSDYTFLVMRA